MKKTMEMIIKILPILVMVVLVIANVYASQLIEPSLPGVSNENLSNITKAAGTIWNTAAIIIQILAIAAIVIAGVRYMFASADQKADVKKQTFTLVLGGAFVFGAVKIAELISGAVGKL